MVDRVDEDGEAEDVGEEDEFLCFPPLRLVPHVFILQECWGDTYLSHIGRDLAHLLQEGKSRHPFLGAESSLLGEVVEMRDETLEDVFHAFIFAEGIDPDDVFSDIVDREVFHGGDLDL